LALFEERFQAWAAADFDAYAEAKRKSNRFNLERGRVRQRCLSLLEQALAHATDAVPELRATGADLELWTSRDHPAFVNDHQVVRQLAVWCRPTAAREALLVRGGAPVAEPDRGHPHAGLCLDDQGVTLLWRVPAAALSDQATWRAAQEAIAALAQQPGADLLIDGELREFEALAQAAAAPDHVEITVRRAWTRQEALDGAAGIEEVAAWSALALPVLRAAMAPVPEATSAAASASNAEPASVPATPVAATERAEKGPAAVEAPAVQADSDVTVTAPGAPEPVRPRAYRPQTRAPARAIPAELPMRAPIERIVPPTWDPALLEQQRLAEEARVWAEQDRLRAEAARQRAARAQEAPRPGPARPNVTRPDSPGPDSARPGPAWPGPPRHEPPRADRGPPHRPAQSWQGPPQGERPQHERSPGPPERRPQEPRFDRSPPRPGGRPYELGPDPREAQAPVGEVAPGAKVTLTTGLFAGKTATVTQVSGDQVQVMVGLLALKVSLRDVRAGAPAR